jgi:hypothetical protein
MTRTNEPLPSWIGGGFLLAGKMGGLTGAGLVRGVRGGRRHEAAAGEGISPGLVVCAGGSESEKRAERKTIQARRSPDRSARVQAGFGASDRECQRRRQLKKEVRMRACRNETSGAVAGTSVSARGLALAAGMLTVMGVGGAGVSPAQGGIVVSSVGFGFGGGDCWGDDSLRVRVSSFNSWCDEWVHRRVAWDCGPSYGGWGYRPWGYRWNAHALVRSSWYEPCDMVVGQSWRWWRDPVADVYVYRPVVIAPSRAVVLPYEPSRVIAADVDGDGYIDEGESAVLVPTAPVYVGAPVVWGPAPVVVYRTYRPWCPPRYYDDCFGRPIYSSVTVCDNDWWGSTRVSVSITIGLGSRSWNHWNRWGRCDDWRRWDDRWCGPVHGPRRDQVTINNPVFNGPVYFNGNTNVNGGVFAPNGPTQIAAGPVVAPAVVPVVAARESKESGRGERRSGMGGVQGEGASIVAGGDRLGEASRQGLRDNVRDSVRDTRRAEGSKILTGDEAAAAVGGGERGGRAGREARDARGAGDVRVGERSASRGEARAGEGVENNEPKRPTRVDDRAGAERGREERKPSATAAAPAPVLGESVKRPGSIGAGEARATRDSRDDVRGRGVPSAGVPSVGETVKREGEPMPGDVGRAERAERGERADRAREERGETKGEREVGEVTSRRGVVETRGGGGSGNPATGDRRAVVKPEASPDDREGAKPTARGVRPVMSERGGEVVTREAEKPRGGTGSTERTGAPSVRPVTTRQPRVMQPVLSPEPGEVKVPSTTERSTTERATTERASRPRETELGGVRRETPARAEPRLQPRLEPRAEKPSAAPATTGIPVPANTGRGERKGVSPSGDAAKGAGEATVVSPRRSTEGAGVVREAKPSVPSAGPRAEVGSIPGVTPTTSARQRVRAPMGGGMDGGRSESAKPAVVSPSPSRVKQPTSMPGAMPGMTPGASDEERKPSSRGMGERRGGYGGVQVGNGSGGGGEMKPGRTSSAGARQQSGGPMIQPQAPQPPRQAQPQVRPAAPAPAPAPSAAPAPSQPAAPSKGSDGGESKGGGGERKRG